MARSGGLLKALFDLVQATLKFLITIFMLLDLRSAARAQRRVTTRLNDRPQPLLDRLGMTESDLDQILRGDISRLNAGEPTGVILQRGERALMTVDGYELMDQVTAPGISHGIGVSTGGISLRTGRVRLSGGGTERRPLGKGRLVITNLRVLFAGDSTTIDVPLMKVVGCQPYASGFDLSISGERKTLTFYAPIEGRLPCAIILGAAKALTEGEPDRQLEVGAGSRVSFRLDPSATRSR